MGYEWTLALVRRDTIRCLILEVDGWGLCEVSNLRVPLITPKSVGQFYNELGLSHCSPNGRVCGGLS